MNSGFGNYSNDSNSLTESLFYKPDVLSLKVMGIYPSGGPNIKTLLIALWET